MTVPPSADDNNPFQRASAWPRMPQAPFRIGPLPKTTAGSPQASVPAPQAAPEPARPPAAPQPRGVLSGGATPGLFGAGPMSGVVARPAAQPVSQPDPPAPEPAVAPQPVAPEPVAATPEPPAATPEPPPMEVAEVVVAPARAALPDDESFESTEPAGTLRRSAAARSRRSLTPLIAAGVAAAAGVGALAYLLKDRGPAPELKVVVQAPPPVSGPAPLVAAALPATEASPALQAQPMAVAPPAPAAPPVRMAATARRAAARTPSAAVASEPAPTSAEPPAPAAAPAPIALPPVAPPPAAPAAPPAAAPKPPADPNAPIATKPTYSE
jgi:Meckel syndrome type 1 protein